MKFRFARRTGRRTYAESFIDATALLMLILFVGGCSSNADKKRTIETYDDISISESSQGTRFNYTMYWILPDIRSLQRDKSMHKRINKQAYLLSQQNYNPELNRVTLDGKTKVRLEDMAVAKLARKMKVRELCLGGHTIEQTFWQERSIKLSGVCL